MPPFSHAHPASAPSIQPSAPANHDALLAEAVAVQDLLRDALARVSTLIVALKQQRRERKAVASVLGSLQRLQPWPRPSS